MYTNEEPGVRTDVVTPIPNVTKLHYVCSLIDRHNRCRQADLALQRKLKTKDWSYRVSISLLSMTTVDAWLCRGLNVILKSISQVQIYSKLAEELIYDEYDSGVQTRHSVVPGSGSDGDTTTMFRSLS